MYCKNKGMANPVFTSWWWYIPLLPGFAETLYRKSLSSGSIMGNEIYGLILVKDTLIQKTGTVPDDLFMFRQSTAGVKVPWCFLCRMLKNHYPIGDELPDTYFWAGANYSELHAFRFDRLYIARPGMNRYPCWFIQFRGSAYTRHFFSLTELPCYRWSKITGTEMLVSPSSWKSRW